MNCPNVKFVATKRVGKKRKSIAPPLLGLIEAASNEGGDAAPAGGCCAGTGATNQMMTAIVRKPRGTELF